jgi:tripartite-type tricarboxylate transporter receptor subunit TctC
VKSTTLRVCGCAAAMAALAVAFAGSAAAQSYPARPVRLIIPFSPGGAADVPGRILGDRLTKVLGQQVVIENRPGAGSTIGAEAAAKAAPDGYTLFMISNTHFVSAGLYKKLTYDSLNDFTPITQITAAPNILVIHPSLPAKNVKELIALAKSRPGQINYASSGNGSTQRPGYRRPDRRAGASRVPGDRRHAAAHQGGQAARARNQQREALTRVA